MKYLSLSTDAGSLAVSALPDGVILPQLRETAVGNRAASMLQRLAGRPPQSSASSSDAGRVRSDAQPVTRDAEANRAMDAYAEGDESAFACVYDSVAPRVFAYLVRQTRDETVAADLLQQTLLQIIRNRGSYLRGSPVLPWAFAIARRIFIDDYRRRRTDALANSRAVAEDDGTATGAPDEEVSTQEAAQCVRAALARLPESQRVAFELLRIEGLSHEDAARVLGVTPSAVKLRAFRAYSALRAALAEFTGRES
jgi:RNA polymerase sigma-70 factor, ECF subfamily